MPPPLDPARTRQSDEAPNLVSRQAYKGNAPRGINLPASVAGIDGAGVAYADMEGSWQLDHEDLKALGIIVLAAAGNGWANQGPGYNLDDPACQGAFDSTKRDSLAIIVGAGTSASRKRMGFSDYGSRATCRAGASAWRAPVMATPITRATILASGHAGGNARPAGAHRYSSGTARRRAYRSAAQHSGRAGGERSRRVLDAAAADGATLRARRGPAPIIRPRDPATG